MTSPQLSIAICDDEPSSLALLIQLVTAILRFLKLEEDDESVEILRISDHLKAEELAASGTLVARI